MQITALAKKTGKPPVTVEYDMPATLADKVAAFTEEVVNANVEDSLVISIQALMRRGIEKGATQEEIQKAVSEWRPNVRSSIKMSAFEKATSSITKLSPEERAELLRQLQEAA